MNIHTPELVFFAAAVAMLAVAIVNVTFAIGVFADASRMAQDKGRGTRIVPGPMWAFATLVGGVLVATAYWFVHHSTLSDND